MPAFQSLMQTIAGSQPLWDLLSSVLKTIGGILGAVVGVAIALVILHVQGLIAVFNEIAKVAGPPLQAIFKGIGDVVNNVAKYVSDLIKKVGELIASFGKVKVPDLGGLFGGGKKGNPTKKFSGISNVTRDEMPALLHKGERVLTVLELCHFRR